MKNTNFLWLVMAMTLGCTTSYVVTSDFEQDVDFNDYHTYQILKPKRGLDPGTNPINQQRIARAIVREMSRLQFSAQKEPDLLVSFFIRNKVIREIDYYHFYRGRWGYPGWNTVRHYEVGSLVVDLIDAKRKRVVWHGVASADISELRSNPEAKINGIVQELFIRFESETNRRLPLAVIE